MKNDPRYSNESCLHKFAYTFDCILRRTCTTRNLIRYPHRNCTHTHTHWSTHFQNNLLSNCNHSGQNKLFNSHLFLRVNSNRLVTNDFYRIKQPEPLKKTGSSRFPDVDSNVDNRPIPIRTSSTVTREMSQRDKNNNYDV